MAASVDRAMILCVAMTAWCSNPRQDGFDQTKE
jgi:hypothetical protein